MFQGLLFAKDFYCFFVRDYFLPFAHIHSHSSVFFPQYRDPAEVARRAQERASSKMKRQQEQDGGEEEDGAFFGGGT